MKQMEPLFGKEERDAVYDYMKGDVWLMEHKQTRKLEQMICEFTGAKFCSMVPNGTLSLSASLYVCGVKPGDEVIVPDHTIVATATAVSFIGAKPKFCDVEKETACLDYKEVEKSITDKTRAIMLVSINGRMPKEFEEIKEICKENNLYLIEDSAQSLGSLYKGKQIGTLGDVGSFSFSISKVISMGSGGAIVTDDENIHQKIQLLKNFGRKKGGIDVNIYPGIDLKYNDLQATVGIEQMKKLKARIAIKKHMFELYRDLLHKDVEFLETDLKETSPWMVDIYLENEGEKKNLVNYLNTKEIQTRPFYPSISGQNLFGGRICLFPNSMEMSKRGLWLPSSLKLNDDDIRYVCQNVKEGLK